MNAQLDMIEKASEESLRFAEQLRTWRIFKNMTQQELADAADVSKSSISMAERAFHTLPPKEITQRKLASALGITLQELRDVHPDIVRMSPSMAQAVQTVISEGRGVSRICRNEYSPREMDDLVLPATFVRAYVDDSTRLTFYPVIDQAMQPTLRVGDIAVLEPPGETSTGIFLVGFKTDDGKIGVTGIRRVTASGTGKVRMSCDNERFERTPSSSQGDTILLGRVVFAVKASSLE